METYKKPVVASRNSEAQFVTISTIKTYTRRPLKEDSQSLTPRKKSAE